MATLHLSQTVACAAGDAARLFVRFFAEYARDGVVVLALRAPIALPGLPPLMLARDCVVRLRPACDEGIASAACDVAWEPAGGGPFPRFTGSIAVGADGPLPALVLDGTYEAPSAAERRAFDAALGRAVAESTGRDVLARLGSYVECASRAAGAARANRAAARR